MLYVDIISYFFVQVTFLVIISEQKRIPESTMALPIEKGRIGYLYVRKRGEYDVYLFRNGFQQYSCDMRENSYCYRTSKYFRSHDG